MKSVQILNVCLLICGFLFASTFADPISANEDTECARTVVNFLLSENVGRIPPGFHAKSKEDKMILAFQEVISVMQNGNQKWRNLAQKLSKKIEDFGGESRMREVFDQLDPTKSFATMGIEISKCFLFSNFDEQWETVKASLGNSLGASRKVLPMIKDMYLTEDIVHDDVTDIQLAVTANGLLAILSLSDEHIDLVAFMLSSQ